MAEKKVIAVVGATGAQGGGLCRAILEDKESPFAVRALTRDVRSQKARELAALGAEVVAADVEDLKSLERALQGAHGAYLVTFFWAHMSAEKETREAQNLAKAAKASGVAHAIWSTLEDTRKWVPTSDRRMPTLQDKYKVPHFDVKGESNHFFTELRVPTTFLNTSFYWDNFIHFGMGPKRGPDGALAITLPLADKGMPGIASEDIGRCAYGVFKRGAELVGQTIGIAGEMPTGAQMAQGLSKALGLPIRYNAVSPDAYRAFGFPGADELGNMFQVKADFEREYCAARSVELARSLNPALKSFETWAMANKDRIPIG